MRLFIAIPLPESVKTRIQVPLKKKGKIEGIRWIPSTSLHLTLKFLGTVDPSQVEPITSVMKEVAQSKSKIELSLAGAGVFPTKKKPRVFWTGLKGEVDKVNVIAKLLEERLSQLGFPDENRKFKPHVTVGRSGRNVEDGMTASDQFCTLFSSFSSDVFEANEIRLMESQLTPTGSKYSVLASFPINSDN